MNLLDLKRLFRRNVKVVAGGPTTLTRGVGVLAALDAVAEEATASPNSRNSLLKAYRYLTRAEIAANGGYGEAFEDLDYGTCCIQTKILVEKYQPDPAQPVRLNQVLVAVWDSTAYGQPDRFVHVDGSFREGDTTPAKFVPIESVEARYGYVRRDTNPASITDWHLAELSIWSLSGTDQFATAKQAGGPFPAFTGVEDAYWKPVAAPAPVVTQNLLDTANTWKERQTFLKGLGLYNGTGFDEYGQLTIGQILLADKFLWRGSVQKMAKDVLFGWSPDEYAGQNTPPDVALVRDSSGVLELNTGTKGSRATILVKELEASDAPATLNTLSKIAAALGLRTSLLTTAKTSLVAAINELVPRLGATTATDPAAPLSRLVWQLVGNPTDYNESLGPLAASTALPSIAYYNRFGRNVTRCKLGNRFTSNILGNNNDGHTFGENFDRNILGSYCTDVVFGSDASYNRLGQGVQTVRASSGCTYNQLADGVYDVTLLNNVSRCSVGLGCRSVTLGAGCERVELYNCTNLTIAAGTKGQIWRDNQLQVQGSGGGSGTSYTDAQARAAQLNRVAPAGTTSVTLTAEAPTDYGTAASGSFTVDATNCLVGKCVRFAVGVGATAPAFTNSPAGQPYKYLGAAYASGKAFSYSLLVCVDRIEVVILAE